MQPDVTLVITSCDRPALLERTLKSITSHDLNAIERFIVIEDSPNPDIADLVKRRLGDTSYLFLQNPKNLGQIASIDRAYAEVTTPYIYHCEDDWLFPSSLFIEESRRILEARPDIHAVMLRDRNEAHKFEKKNTTLGCVAGIPVRLADPRGHRRWGGFSFNPGLRRTADYTKYAPYGRLGPEAQISSHYKRCGFRMAYLEAGDVATYRRWA